MALCPQGQSELETLGSSDSAHQTLKVQFQNLRTGKENESYSFCFIFTQRGLFNHGWEACSQIMQTPSSAALLRLPPASIRSPLKNEASLGGWLKPSKSGQEDEPNSSSSSPRRLIGAIFLPASFVKEGSHCKGNGATGSLDQEAGQGRKQSPHFHCH